MKHWRSIVVLLLVFMAGVAVGAFSVRTVVRRAVAEALNHPERPQVAMERALVRRLQLDASQQAGLHEILVSSRGQLADIRHTIQPRLAAIFQSTDDQITALLKPEQIRRYERFEEQFHPFWHPQPRPLPGTTPPAAAN